MEVTKISNGAVIVAGVEHGQVKKSTHLEVSPDTEIVVHVDLPDRHPLKVSANGVHLALIDTDAAEAKEGVFGIVHSTEAISVAVVGNLMVVPHGDPSELLVREEQVGVGPVLGYSGPVVIQGEKSSGWVGSTRIAA